MSQRIYYRKEKLRGACWEYQIEGGWLTVPGNGADTRQVLQHRFTFYRPRVVEVRTAAGMRTMSRTAAEQWFFPDRWFSLLRFLTDADETVGYYVNFSRPLAELRTNYYQDLDLELDLWLDPDGTATELDRDEFDLEVQSTRLRAEWASEVEAAYLQVVGAVRATLGDIGPDLDGDRSSHGGVPGFILRA